MEVEVKLRLGTKEEHDKAYQAFGGNPKVTHNQTNTFFDGLQNPLEKTRSVMRIRSINDGAKYVLTLKGNAKLENGVSRVEEDEEELKPTIAKSILDNPDSITTHAKTNESSLLSRIFQRFPNDNWKVIGSFQTIRKKFDWEGYEVELDETKYDFGSVAYEIELETPEPEVAKKKMEGFLRAHNITFSNSTRNKFVNMIRRSIV